MENLTGQKFGRLTLLEPVMHKTSSGRYRYAYRCLCDCGNERIVFTYNLKNGHTQSCGCQGYERRTVARITHHQSNSRLYSIWDNMNARCFNHKNTCYVRYGGRGITVCDEWRTFENFYNWAMSSGYSDELTIDRIDVDGNYCPENCRWADFYTQANNKKNNRFIEFKGKKMTIPQWSRETGISQGTIRSRIDRLGWSVEDALTRQVGCAHET